MVWASLRRGVWAFATLTCVRHRRDRWRDIEAGRNAGTRTVFIDRGYAEKQPDSADLTVADLQKSVPWILQTAR